MAKGYELHQARMMALQGMGKDLAATFPSARGWFDRANAALGYDLAAICFNGPDAELTKTENAQPGIFLVSWVALQLLQERVPALRFDATAGLSLGEFTALTAAGALSFENGLRVVRQRGRFDADALVLGPRLCHPALTADRHLDGTAGTELDGVRQQVLGHLAQAGGRPAPDHRPL